jgi:non-ribosomal peptide synthetase component F
LAIKNQVTLNTVVQTVWGILLGKYVGRSDVVFGAVVSGRPSEIEGVETMVGLFINTIPVRIQYEDKMNFAELVRRIQQEAVDSTLHHYYPLAEIQAALRLKQNLFDHIVAFENFPIEDQIDGMTDSGRSKSEARPLKSSNVEIFAQSNYDLEVTVIDGKRLTVDLNFNADSYEPRSIEKISGQFNDLLLQVSKKPTIHVHELTLVSEEEKRQLLQKIREKKGKLLLDNIEINQQQDHVLTADFDY